MINLGGSKVILGVFRGARCRLTIGIGIAPSLFRLLLVLVQSKYLLVEEGDDGTSDSEVERIICSLNDPHLQRLAAEEAMGK